MLTTKRKILIITGIIIIAIVSYFILFSTPLVDTQVDSQDSNVTIMAPAPNYDNSDIPDNKV